MVLAHRCRIEGGVVLPACACPGGTMYGYCFFDKKKKRTCTPWVARAAAAAAAASNAWSNVYIAVYTNEESSRDSPRGDSGAGPGPEAQDDEPSAIHPRVGGAPPTAAAAPSCACPHHAQPRQPSLRQLFLWGTALGRRASRAKELASFPRQPCGCGRAECSSVHRAGAACRCLFPTRVGRSRAGMFGGRRGGGDVRQPQQSVEGGPVLVLLRVRGRPAGHAPHSCLRPPRSNARRSRAPCPTALRPATKHWAGLTPALSLRRWLASRLCGPSPPGRMLLLASTCLSSRRSRLRRTMVLRIRSS